MTENGRYLALSPEDFERFQLNQADVVRYIREANAQIEYYREQL